MKKKFMVSLMLALVLTGCSSQDVDQAKDITVESTSLESMESEAEADQLLGYCTTEELDERKANCLATAQYGDLMDTMWWNKPLDPSTIVEDVVSGRKKYELLYYTLDRDGFIYTDVFYGGSETQRLVIYPNAVLSDETWQADDLVDSYLKETLPWKRCGDLEARIFTPDYRICFTVYEGWLWANGMRLRPIDDPFGSVDDPLDLLDDYQHGCWDGTRPAYSIDYSTVAEINYNGQLTYTYRTSEYSDEYDPRHLAYTGYMDPPEFMTVGSNFFKVGHTNHYDYDYDDGRTGRVFEADVEIYPDLPDGSKAGFEDVIQFEYDGSENGMYVVTKHGVSQYRRGVLMDSWELEIDPEYYWINFRAFRDEVHLQISQNEIVRLLPDGVTETVIDGLVEGEYGIGEYPLMSLSLKDGKVVGYSWYFGMVEIAENIASIDHAWNILLMTGEDGLCYAIDRIAYAEMEDEMRDQIMLGRKPPEFVGNLAPVCLGDKPWEHYLELYNAGLLEISVAE